MKRLVASAFSLLLLEAWLLPWGAYAEDTYTTAISAYQKLVDEGGWKPIPGSGPLKKGDEGERVEALRQRLVKTGELEASLATGATFDDAVEQAVKRFQLRHGEEGDGVIGAETLAALNIPAEKRLHQLQLNQFRWSTLPKLPPGKAVFVNIPNFSLAVTDNGKTVMTMRVVVGKGFTATPLMTDEIEKIVINPYWNVPTSIVRDEMAKKALENPNYFAEKNLEILRGADGKAKVLDPASIDWANLGSESLGFRIRQKPGPENSLGQIKFLFPNHEDVYLHDTPEKALFDKNERVFSHGCIRVEQPVQLAALLLDDDPSWTLGKIEQAMSNAETVEIQPANKIPIQLAYWTAWVGAEGDVQFREDIYGLDDQTLDEAKAQNAKAEAEQQKAEEKKPKETAKKSDSKASR